MGDARGPFGTVRRSLLSRYIEKMDLKTRAIPITLAHRPRPSRFVGEQGLPIFRISYTLVNDRNGKREIMLKESPTALSARLWAQRQKFYYIVVGRWLGGLSFTPTTRTPYVPLPDTRSSFGTNSPIDPTG